MLARSARFDDAVRFGGAIDYRVYVQRADPSTGAVATLADNLRVLGSPRVDVDTTAASRRSIASITIADDDGVLVANDANDALSPYGSELVVETGFAWADGTVERLPLGVFRIGRTRSTGRGQVTCTRCVDRSIVVRENRFEEPYVVAGGTNLVTACVTLLQNRYPGLVVYAEPTTRTVPSTQVFLEGSHSGDPGRNLDELLAAAGMEWFIDATGAGVIRKVPDPATSPAVWDYTAYAAATLYVDGANELDAEGIGNVAVVTGEGTGIPVPIRRTRAVTDISSPVHPARVGRKPTFLTSPLITTNEQGDEATLGLLLRKSRGSERFQLVAAPHPAHDGGDVVHVADEDIGVDTNVVLVKFGIPITSDDTITYDTAARRSA